MDSEDRTVRNHRMAKNVIEAILEEDPAFFDDLPETTFVTETERMLNPNQEVQEYRGIRYAVRD